ncbi:acyl carrier protein phosphodiesterase [Marivirga sp. S37H4]|uniref:Acyl carrier protein phosphodiesterase n=1 Tax=Marivirga aurantiaca TaxID=2802615 RepID=A0A935C7S7_9BACT|nr:acyl carrier protein phosphodiesterase [Marivirga aurantiaca]MBK6265196.1 acyl carrier protein phosphodiesterase [Marivirga aurantiaca]
MNFLAHLYLSGNDPELAIGNFIADFIKGAGFENFPPKIQQGILLHRAIDEFTDNHPIVLQSKKRLQPIYRHYSGVIVDIYYDHFLALDWEKFHTKSLRVYVNEQYSLLQSNFDKLPLPTQKMLPFMIQHDWLYNYQYLDGIQRVMKGMASRTKFNSKMEQSVKELKFYHEEFRAEFHLFFPELIEFSNQTIKSFRA